MLPEEERVERIKSQFPEFRFPERIASRVNEETEHKWRTAFERDRDRILYSKAFHRLIGKTQVFVAGYDDHIRNRLTHTLEVAQIAKTISQKLKLNTNLVEAVALGHDLGHTPFGHVGERVLNLITNSCLITPDWRYIVDLEQRGFKHNYQSLRVCMQIEKYKPEYEGINLTKQTLWGMLNHSGRKFKSCNLVVFDGTSKICNANKNKECVDEANITLPPNHYECFTSQLGCICWSTEAFIVEWADEIAQRHHDVVDAIEAKILNPKTLCEKIVEIFNVELKGYKTNLKKISEKNDKDYLINNFSSWIVDYYVNNIISEFKQSLFKIKKAYKIKSNNEFVELLSNTKNDDAIKMFDFNSGFIESDKQFGKFLKNTILNSYQAQKMDGKADYIIKKLFSAFITNPQQLPDTKIFQLSSIMFGKRDITIGEMREELKKADWSDKNNYTSLIRIAVDYIAGMTDSYAIHKFKQLYHSDIERLM